MRYKRMQLSVMLVVMLLISMAFVPAVSAKNVAKDKNEEIIAEPWIVGIDDLNRLGTNELNNLAEQNETVKKLIEEDKKIGPVEIESIEDLKYIPSNYPTEIKNLNEKNFVLNFQEGFVDQQFSTQSVYTVYVWIAADEEYRNHFGSNWQTEAYNTIESADNAFYSGYNINFIVQKYSEWDSDDSVHDSALFTEAKSETGWETNKQGMDMLAVFTNQWTTSRGWSEEDGDAWFMKHQLSADWDWHLAQHEASHNYFCQDHGYFGPDCIMTYTYMMITDSWCSSCATTIENNKNHFG